MFNKKYIIIFIIIFVVIVNYFQYVTHNSSQENKPQEYDPQEYHHDDIPPIINNTLYIYIATKLWGEDSMHVNRQEKCEKYMVSFTDDKAIKHHMSLYYEQDTPINLKLPINPNIPRTLFSTEHFYYYTCLATPSCAEKFNWVLASNSAADILIPYFSIINGEKYFRKMASFNFETDIMEPKRKFIEEEKNLISNNNNNNLNNIYATGSWMSSICEVKGSNRCEYIEELMKYMKIDSYGSCLHNRNINGTGISDRYQSDQAYNKLQTIGKYKFYFSFENSLTNGYITEKSYECLAAGTVPVIMTHPLNTRYLPRGSYISVHDFSSAKDLAGYLLYLDMNDYEYKQYFNWRTDHQILQQWKEHLPPGFFLGCNLANMYSKWLEGLIPKDKVVNVESLKSNVLPRDFYSYK